MSITTITSRVTKHARQLMNSSLSEHRETVSGSCILTSGQSTLNTDRSERRRAAHSEFYELMKKSAVRKKKRKRDNYSQNTGFTNSMG